jgi:hypothetical protein
MNFTNVHRHIYAWMYACVYIVGKYECLPVKCTYVSLLTTLVLSGILPLGAQLFHQLTLRYIPFLHGLPCAASSSYDVPCLRQVLYAINAIHSNQQTMVLRCQVVKILSC